MVEAYQSKVFHSSRILTTSMATDGEVSVAASLSSINRALRVFRYVAQIRHLPIVLVKVAYHASGSARFLPKLCSNYARFSKLCYFLKKLFCAQTSQLTSSCIFQWWIRGVYPGQVVQALVYPLCSRYLVNYLDASSLHLTVLAWRPPF